MIPIPIRCSGVAVDHGSRGVARIADGVTQVFRIEPGGVVGDIGPGGGQIDRALATAGKRPSALWIRVAQALQCMPPNSSSAVATEGPSCSRRGVASGAPVSIGPLAHGGGGIPDFGDGGTDLLHVERGRVVLDHPACRVKVDQGRRYALTLVERLLNERHARATVHALHRELGDGNLSTGRVWGSQ